MVLYLPTERDQQGKSGAQQQLYKVASQVLQSAPTRSIPILFLDANGHVGWVKDEHTASHSVGKSGCELENQNGKLLRTFTKLHGLWLVNTWNHDGSGPTWTNGEGVVSRIDFLAVLRRFSDSVRRCYVCYRTAIACQGSTAHKWMDHAPVSMEFVSRDWHNSQEHQRHNWDRQ
eukprot:7083381-Heterocapsa_arctica.AAC.1